MPDPELSAEQEQALPNSSINVVAGCRCSI